MAHYLLPDPCMEMVSITSRSRVHCVCPLSLHVQCQVTVPPVPKQVRYFYPNVPAHCSSGADPPLQMRWVVKPEFRGIYHTSAAVGHGQYVAAADHR